MALDPNRYMLAELVDATHVLPMLDGRLFGAEETVDLFDQHTQMLLAGGSIRQKTAVGNGQSAVVFPAAEEAAPALDLREVDPHE